MPRLSIKSGSELPICLFPEPCLSVHTELNPSLPKHTKTVLPWRTAMKLLSGGSSRLPRGMALGQLSIFVSGVSQLTLSCRMPRWGFEHISQFRGLLHGVLAIVHCSNPRQVDDGSELLPSACTASAARGVSSGTCWSSQQRHCKFPLTLASTCCSFFPG